MAFSFPQIDWNVVYFEDGKPTQAFQILWDQVAQNFNAVAAAAAAQASANAAQAAAVTAQTAAASATTDAATAQSAADSANSVAALTNSGVTGLTITATDAGASVTLTISAHTRVYGDGDTLAIAGPDTSLTGLAYSTLDYVYYDDPTRADTTPTYAVTTSEATAAQVGDRHLIGSVTTPAAAAPPETGDYVRPPGVGGILP